MHNPGRYSEDRIGDEDLRLSPAMRAQLERYEQAYGTRLNRGAKQLKPRQRRRQEDWITIH